MQTFFVIQRRRSDGKQMVELEKALPEFHLAKEDAQEEMERWGFQDSHQILELVADFPPSSPTPK
jgi:hypothetical protein